MKHYSGSYTLYSMQWSGNCYKVRLALAQLGISYRLVELDIRDREAVRANLAGADFVFHQAALRWTRCQKEPRECQEVMVDGAFNVLEAAADAKVRRVILASSAVVYG